jgi:hypothetical protein
MLVLTICTGTFCLAHARRQFFEIYQSSESCRPSRAAALGQRGHTAAAGSRALLEALRP